MIKIEISDLEHTDAKALRLVSQFLLDCTGREAPVPAPEFLNQIHAAPPPPPQSVPKSSDYEVPQNMQTSNPFAAQGVTDVAWQQQEFPFTAGIDVDSAGLPWDARIHASTKSKSEDGTWRKRRGVKDDVAASVNAELTQTMALPITPVAASVPPPPFAINAVPPVSPVIASILPVALPNGVAPIVCPSSDGATFPKLMQKVTGAFSAGQITQAQILAAVQSVGLPSLPMLASRPDLIGAVGTALGLAL